MNVFFVQCIATINQASFNWLFRDWIAFILVYTTILKGLSKPMLTYHIWNSSPPYKIINRLYRILTFWPQIGWFTKGFLIVLAKNILTSIPVYLSNYINYNVWYEITYPFPNFNGGTVEVWEWITSSHILLDMWSLIHTDSVDMCSTDIANNTPITGYDNIHYLVGV